jgi:peptidoglycan/xylan/chitin deacetylase (PgdA/CDA1 family)
MLVQVTWTKRRQFLAAVLLMGSTALAGATAGVAHAGTTATASGAARTGQARGSRARTVVTFAWGGGFANQIGALPSFRRYGMHATFFVPSGLVCQPAEDPDCTSLPYLTLSQVHEISDGGNEIGGLTVEHVPLDNLPAAEAQREICDDRINLTRWGFRVTDFAYPFALVSRTLQALAKRCGYNAGLGTGQLRGAGLCGDCPWAETIPPLNPFLVRTPIEVASVGTMWSPATFENIVTGAQQHGGGWIIFTIHDVCARPCSLGVTVPELDSVLGWLAGQAAHGVTVRTMRQVIGGPVRPLVPGPRPPGIPRPGVLNSRLTAASAGGIPACFQTSHYGTNHATFRYERHGGPDRAGAEAISLARRQSGTAQLLPTLDLGECAPTVAAGRNYTVGAWYKSSEPVEFNLYYRTSLGTWEYWSSSPAMAASRDWTRARWTSAAVPAGASALSFGLALRSDGTMATSKYSLLPGSPPGSSLGPFGIVVLIVVGVSLVVLALVAAGAVARRFRRRGGHRPHEG